MLGRSIARLSGTAWQPLPSSASLDIRNREEVLGWFKIHQPDVVLHVAAMTAVDACETNPELAFAVNRDGTRHIAEAANEVGARIVYVSTDYVFNGGGERPWKPEDPVSPLNVYGSSKQAGEDEIRNALENHAIARVSWLYGPGGPSFFHTMARLGARRNGGTEPLRVVSDQIGAPTNTEVLAGALRALAESNVQGTFHLAPTGAVSWYEYARTIFKCLGLHDVPIEPCSSTEFPRPAPRPHNSRLDTHRFDRLGLYELGTWEDGVIQFAQQYREELIS